ncbi:MAG: hypothetical protein KAT94_03520 [Candidatus Aenigmarchaeota archaeon]|nr:hypothetical protein [Candidatus Aenigmarchaeota archaeon]
MDRAKMSFVILNLVVIVMLSFVFVNLVTIPLISPENGLYTTDRKPEFNWGGMQGEFVIFLDEDPDFGTPLKKGITGNSYRFGDVLDLGNYYWKVGSGLVTSEVRKLTIGSSVVLSREENEVKNEGNVDLLIHRITGAFLLDVNESIEMEEDEDVKAEQA